MCSTETVSPSQLLRFWVSSAVLHHTVEEGQTALSGPATTARQPIADVASNACIDYEHVFICFSFSMSRKDFSRHKGVILGSDTEKRNMKMVSQSVKTCRIIVILIEIGVAFCVDGDGIINIGDLIRLYPPQ
mmetsp:Transcript_16029/g.30283  ORF Transcript_16029/g.30283 Transcript_16029/m.30283 type:complete len:132 (-) Transcript_16029:824-1219(-)